MTPVISVVMPVHNAGRFLRRALDSILAQSERDLELIALDDGSTDGSRAVLQAAARADRRVRIIRLEHGGIVNALNRGISEARGRFIARMDADDIALPDRLSLQLAEFENNPEVVGLGGAALAVDPRDRPISPLSPPANHEAIRELLLRGKGSAIIHPTLMVRAEAMREVGGYREEFCHIEDLDLYWRLGQVGRLANLEEVVLRYRQHPRSANLRFADLQRERTVKWLREVVGRGATEGPPDLEFYRPATRSQLYADWSARALRASYRKTAMIYAMKSITRAPHRATGWRLLASVVRSVGRSRRSATNA